MAPPNTLLGDFLKPLGIGHDTVYELYEGFVRAFEKLAEESTTQFLPTPISESILRPVGQCGSGRYVHVLSRLRLREPHVSLLYFLGPVYSVKGRRLRLLTPSNSGGTNLRAGFVELMGKEDLDSHANGVDTNGALHHFTKPSGSVRRQLERSWPIDDHLKSQNADSLFRWIGQSIAEVVRDGCDAWSLPKEKPLPLGVTFSFPMVQNSLPEATLMGMGKGFAIESNTRLGARLVQAYNLAKTDDLPPIEVAAIANDSVSTLVSFIFRFHDTAQRRATMGLILGTGCNATIPLKLSRLHPSKRPTNVSVLPGEEMDNVRIAVNTEWSINGSAPPLRELGLITRWDQVLDAQNETPGFQPLEYMTAGRYLGELGRIIFVDYLTTVMEQPRESLPSRLLQKDSMTTTFLSHYKPLQPSVLAASLKEGFPESTVAPLFVWTEEHAAALYHIAKAIQTRAAGIIAAAVLALMTVAEEIPATTAALTQEPRELGVGYTGGCIVHFQDYLSDCQAFLDDLARRRFGETPPVKVVLSPCHDGGVTGAGILVAAALSSRNAEM
ncbi:hypothetical protein S40285_06969 [Stachybotrys chlorohalonatus IBT 40285]|uniref:Phosphotransferase n=1 Tax=Stachybotrys chlorohalonatus (strain IBT 40285) TaxID=1283841 RepID=A0A084QV27_STAC4|nr:hypothetical protein S40285_06969 [Stachybotrys chlorohalonata IBT 40285]